MLDQQKPKGKKYHIIRTIHMEGLGRIKLSNQQSHITLILNIGINNQRCTGAVIEK
jgi:hypothetical protein